MAVSPSPASQPDATAPPLATRDDSRPTRLAPRWRLWWTLWWQRHVGFVYLLCFFVAFRLLALLLLRPGGFITDFSDYDFYMTWGTLGPMGYRAYDNLWTAYPPLFPLIMLTVYEWASRIPPWTEPRLAFHLLFGLVLLIFDVGNISLIYRLGGQLGRDETQPARVWGSPGLHAATFYALCFVPLYTMLGWFEPMPLFFMLLGLALLLTPRLWGGPWGWVGSAVAVGLGFLTKLTPILLAPIAVRWLGARLSWRAARAEWFDPRSPGNLLRPAIYMAILLAVIVGVGYPLVRANPALAFSSFRIQSIRPAWQSVWALIDGVYGYGLVPLDMRNLAGLSAPLAESRIPWGLVGLGFALLFLWLYTRPYAWSRVRTPLALTGSFVILLFLYSKGWSPQFLLWVIAFVALLLPTLRGVVLVVLLSVINAVEAGIFLILLPDEHWIMVGTVLARTLLLVLLVVEFLGQIWPGGSAQSVRRAAAGATWAVMALTLVAGVAAMPRAARAYAAQQLDKHPCRAAIDLLQAEAGGVVDTIVTQQPEVWRDLYPWLRQDYTIQVLDGYAVDYDFTAEALRRANALPPQEVWWISRPDIEPSATSPLDAYDQFLAQDHVALLEERTLGACRLDRVLLWQPPAAATVDVAGGPIQLLRAETGPAQVGEALEVVLYWQADSPVAARYTVFTQLFDPTGALVAQQDNWPVEGLAPTDTWEPERVIRDAYRLTIPPDVPPGDYTLWVGMYDEAGRRTLTMAAGESADHLALSIQVREP